MRHCLNGSQRFEKVCVDAALGAHRRLGPGLLESVYEHGVAHVYDGLELEAGYGLDLVVDDAVVLEIKSVDALAPIHQAQVLTRVKLSGLRLGFLLNFNVVLMKHGIQRMIL